MISWIHTPEKTPPESKFWQNESWHANHYEWEIIIERRTDAVELKDWYWANIRCPLIGKWKALERKWTIDECMQAVDDLLRNIGVKDLLSEQIESTK